MATDNNDDLPISNWEKALINCVVMALICGISTFQSSPDVTLKAAAIAGTLTFLVQFKTLLGGRKGGALAVMGIF